MNPVDLFLLVIAAIFVIGVIGEIIFEKTDVPDVVWLILVGILIGPVLGWVSREGLVQIAPYFGALTLVIVLFDGGTELRLRDLGRAAPKASFLAVLSFTLSTLAVAGVSMGAHAVGMIETWGWLQAITLGAIVGGSSSVVIMPALSRAKLDEKLSNLVNIESALTDVLCVVVAGACVQIHLSQSADPAAAAITLGRSFAVGLGVGAAAGFLALLVLRKIRKSQFGYPLVLGGLLVLYVLINGLQGSSALGILTASVIVGNAPSLADSVGMRKDTGLSRGFRNTHDQITFIIKSFFFTFIGAMLAPPWSLIVLGVILGLVLLAARVPAVMALATAAKIPAAQRNLVIVSMPRGMAAGVLAMIPSTVDPSMPGTEILPVVVFACVFTTILVFAVGFPMTKSKLANSGASASPAASNDEPSGGLPAGDALPIPGDGDVPPSPPTAASDAPPPPSDIPPTLPQQPPIPPPLPPPASAPTAGDPNDPNAT
ncbi:MAG: cation:proton antiporter [Nannocystaceae bacterium]